MTIPEITKPIISEYDPSSNCWLSHGECCGVPFMAEGDTPDESITAAIEVAAEAYFMRAGGKRLGAVA